MGDSEWILPLLGIGGLAIGGLLVLPNFMKKEDYGPTPVDYSEAERMLEDAEKLQDLKRRVRRLQYEEDFKEPYTFGNRLPLVVGTPDKDDSAYIITDEDFDKLEIGKRDRRFLNRNRKLKDARLERVVYGDSTNRDLEVTIPSESYFVNTVSPYGQGPAHEFTRLTGPADLSNTNTKSNTINLY